MTGTSEPTTRPPWRAHSQIQLLGATKRRGAWQTGDAHVCEFCDDPGLTDGGINITFEMNLHFI